MFHRIPGEIQERMRYLELLDQKEREQKRPLLQRLRQIPPETGRFIALLAATAPEGTCLEIGTSAGYSTLWLALACREPSKCSKKKLP
jgi:caffeoyl-CoA O-methyltransferase